MLIAAFLLQCTSQLWIIAAFKWNQDYIAANLCINRFDAIPLCKGSCFLEDQLNKDRQQQEKLPDLKTKELNLFCRHNAVLSAPGVPVENKVVKYPFSLVDDIRPPYTASIFHPPSAV